MIYTPQGSGTHEVLQNSFAVCVYSNCIKQEQSPYYKNVFKAIDGVKYQSLVKCPTLFVMRCDDTAAYKHFKALCEVSKDYHLLSVPVNWDNGSKAGLEAFKECLDYSQMAVCVHDGVDKLESIFLSQIDILSTVKYVVYVNNK